MQSPVDLTYLADTVVLGLVWLVIGVGWLALAGVAIVGMLLVYQHTLVKPNDLSRMNAAFFTANGTIVSSPATRATACAAS